MKIGIQEADLASLKQHAEVQMGLEVKVGMNAASLRAKILAMDPEIKEIEQVEAPAKTAKAAKPAPAIVATAPAAAVRVPYSVNTPTHDPRVKVLIHKTTDMFRPKEVDLQVNGFLVRCKRGIPVDLPLRHFYALEAAIEKRAVPSDRENQWGNIEYDYEDVHSYPYQVLEMPPEDEIAAWHAATSGQELKAA